MTTATPLVTGVDFVSIPATDLAAAREFYAGVCHQAFFEDPSGNTIGLHHRYAPPSA